MMIISEMFLFTVTKPTLQLAFINIIIAAIILLNPLIFFYSIWTTHLYGGTPGKLLTGLEVVSENYQKLSFLRIVFRHTIGYAFSYIFFGLGYLAMIKDPKKQTWHDKTVGSLVIQRKNLTLLGLMVSIILTIITIYFLATATQILLKSPLIKELQFYLPAS
jgi:uncharacterized RDD family membrane protein YckC